MSGFWILAIGSLFLTHIRYICLNMTTLDDITIKQKRRYQRYQQNQQSKTASTTTSTNNYFNCFSCFSFKGPRREDGVRYVSMKVDGLRYVVQYDVSERPFDFGWKVNWVNFVNQTRWSEASTREFILSIIILVVPFAELWKAIRKTPIWKTPVWSGATDDERLLYLYDAYTEPLGPEFLAKIEQKILCGDVVKK